MHLYWNGISSYFQKQISIKLYNILGIHLLLKWMDYNEKGAIISLDYNKHEHLYLAFRIKTLYMRLEVLKMHLTPSETLRKGVPELAHLGSRINITYFAREAVQNMMLHPVGSVLHPTPSTRSLVKRRIHSMQMLDFICGFADFHIHVPPLRNLALAHRAEK